MAELIHLEPGQPPWDPSSVSELVTTYDFHDIPLAGLVRQEGSLYAFWCVAGEVEPMSLWAYGRVYDKSEIGSLEKKGRNLYEAFRRTLWDRPLVLALVSEANGVVAHTEVLRPVDYPNLIEASRALFGDEMNAIIGQWIPLSKSKAFAQFESLTASLASVPKSEVRPSPKE